MCFEMLVAKRLSCVSVHGEYAALQLPVRGYGEHRHRSVLTGDIFCRRCWLVVVVYAQGAEGLSLAALDLLFGGWRVCQLVDQLFVFLCHQ